MPKKKMWVEWEDGADLSQSQKKPGDYSPLTRDADNNLGHVTLSDVSDGEAAPAPEPSPESAPEPETVYVFVTDDRESEAEAQRRAERDEFLGALAALGIIYAAQKAAPHLQRWWNDKSLPFLKSARARLSRRRKTASTTVVAEQPVTAEHVPDGSSQEVLTALDDYRASMSSAEARARLVDALVARVYSDQQLRLLRNARIDDDGGGGLELASAMETFTPQQLEESITAMLEANPSWPDEDTLAQLRKALGSKSEPERVPLERELVNKELRIIDGEP